MSRKLTPKQSLFIQEYLKDLNATQSYIRAGYKATGHIAEVNSSKLLRTAKVQDELKKAMARREKRTEVTQDRVIKELSKVAFSNMSDYCTFTTQKTILEYEGDGTPIYGYAQVIEMKDSTEMDTTAISEISSKDNHFRFKLYDKIKAIELLGKHLGMFKDKVELSGNGAEPVNVLFNIPKPDWDKRRAEEHSGK